MTVNHPWYYLLQEIHQRGRTQKDFAAMIGKKVSEVNELLKGKRNITILRDILLAELFGDPEKKRIHLQIEFDYQKEKAKIKPKSKAKKEIKQAPIPSKTIPDSSVSEDSIANDEQKTTPSITERFSDPNISTKSRSDRHPKSDPAQEITEPIESSSAPAKDPEKIKKHEIFRNF